MGAGGGRGARREHARRLGGSGSTSGGGTGGATSELKIMDRIQRLREKIIDIVKKAGRGHLGTSLSSLEALVAVRDIMRPGDLFLSSKGHDAVAQYVVLSEAGILDESQLYTFRTEDGLPGHPTIEVPGIEANTGSLGMGLSKALGFALGQDRTVYVLLGDGEMMEGQNWEAVLAIAKVPVNNIVALIDCNHFSQDGPAALTPRNLDRLFSSVGWNTTIINNGNNYGAIRSALDGTQSLDGPWAIMLNTTKGKGLENEGTAESHFGFPDVVYPAHPLYSAFGDSVDRVMKLDKDVVLVGADTLRDLQCYDLRIKYPSRVFDFGIAEQNAVSFASARALMGQKPIVATYACFLRRAFEQIYNQVTEGTQVVYVGSMAGPLSPSGPGISHQSLDDLDYMSALMPALQFRAQDKEEIGGALNSMLASGSPYYLRLIHE